MRIEYISAQNTLEIRQRVLWPDKPKQHCIVDGDEDARHFGLFLNEVLVAVASTYESDGSVRLRKFAVETEHQGTGLGSVLFKHALNQAIDSGASLFWCDAREDAIEFYKRFGLCVEGEKFYKSGLPYLRMSKELNEFS